MPFFFLAPLGRGRDTLLPVRLKHLLLPCFDPNTGQNRLDPLIQHQGGSFWTKPIGWRTDNTKYTKKCECDLETTFPRPPLHFGGLLVLWWACYKLTG
jgi:hypothetical protein